MFFVILLVSRRFNSIIGSSSDSWLAFTRNKFLPNDTIVLRNLKDETGAEVFIPVSGLPLAITYDFEEKLIFWSEFNPRRSPKSVIKKAKFDGTDVKIVVNATEVDSLFIGLALDWITKHLYYTDIRRRHVGLCEPVTRECTVLIDDRDTHPFRIALDSQAGVMYWTFRGDIPGIYKARMDGWAPARIGNQGVTFPGGIDLDHKAGRLYWVDQDDETVFTSGLDQSGIPVLTPVLITGKYRQLLTIRYTDTGKPH